MKKLIIFMILSSIFSLFASTSTTSTTFEFQAQKKRPSDSEVNDGWKFSINIVDRFHNDGDVLTGLPDIEIAKDSLVNTQDDGTLTSNNLHLFDVIYTTNSFFYPMQIDITFSEFVNTDNSEDTISITPFIDGKNCQHEFIVTSGTDSSSDFKHEYRNLDIIQTAKPNGNTYSLEAKIPYDDDERWSWEWSLSEGWHHESESFRNIEISYLGSYSYADIKYTFPVSISLDDPNSLENKSGTYVMTVKVEAKTDL